jgi:hypothetical protein
MLCCLSNNIQFTPCTVTTGVIFHSLTGCCARVEIQALVIVNSDNLKAASVIDRPMMETSSSIAKLCKVCLRLDIQRMTHPLHPCRDPLPCSTPPINNTRYGADLSLGSVDEIKSRRLTCDICRLIAESLDKVPSELDGGCRIRESAEFCNFELPQNIKARDPSITHFHLTQASVIFDPSVTNELYAPPLPWELKERDNRSSRYIVNFQVSRNRVFDQIDAKQLGQGQGQIKRQNRRHNCGLPAN